MAKRKITIEIEVDRLNSWNIDYTPEFTSKLQIAITDTVQKETKRWNRWHSSQMGVSLTNKQEQI